MVIKEKKSYMANKGGQIMAQYLSPDDYDFYSEKEKYDFIHDTFFDHMYRCPNCGEAYTDADDDWMEEVMQRRSI
jgi:hypothetical protein